MFTLFLLISSFLTRYITQGIYWQHSDISIQRNQDLLAILQYIRPRWCNNCWCPIFAVFRPKTGAPEENLLPEPRFSSALWNLHQHTGSVQPSLSPPRGVCRCALHLWAWQECQLLHAGFLGERGRFPVRQSHKYLIFNGTHCKAWNQHSTGSILM